MLKQKNTTQSLTNPLFAWVLVVLTTVFMLAAITQPAVAVPAAPANPASAKPTSTDDAKLQLERGAYLTRVADCIACHTQDKDKPFAGGYKLITPLGSVFSTNITPDMQTGIGSWTDDEFYAALNDGLGKGGKHLYPVMPYDAYTGISYEDALAIKAYLFAQPAIQQQDLPHELLFPYNYRQLVWGWKALNFHEGTLKPDPTMSDHLNRGAYIGQALAHCGVCHTPRTVTMATDPNRALAGAPIINGWYAPNITPDQLRGIGKWTDAELAQFFRTGIVPSKAYASGPMGDVVAQSLAGLSPSDMSGLIDWLRAIPFDGKPSSSTTRSRFEWGALPVTVTSPEVIDAVAPIEVIVNPIENTTTPDETSQSKPESSNESQSTFKSLLDTVLNNQPANDVPNEGALSEVVPPSPSAVIYQTMCAQCHGANGEGAVNTNYPALRGNTTLGMNQPNNVILSILHGVERQVGAKKISMPTFEDKLYDEQVADLSNWLFQEFGRPQTQTTMEDVHRLRYNLPDGEAPIMAIVKASGVAFTAGSIIFILGWIIRFSPRVKAYISLIKRRRARKEMDADLGSDEE